MKPRKLPAKAKWATPQWSYVLGKYAYTFIHGMFRMHGEFDTEEVALREARKAGNRLRRLHDAGVH